ncbi:ISL3 family transposase [Candidatus Poriferisocius sp.]|uniref:ISL3 family transposase n=1 Tax=Candidatus Poriferisocius sp. TaxID=3101276 RepID=UPI003B01513D
MRLANRALDECRRRTQNDALGHRVRKGDPLYGARKLLLTGAERLSAAARDRIRRALDAGDPYDEVADCWQAKEKIRSVFKTGDADQAAARLGEAIEYCRAPEAAPELHKLARTLTKWRTEIETSVRTRTHNGRTEAANAKIKDVKRSGRGFTNLDNYRLRILLAAGRKPGQTQPVTKIRTRRPRSDA